jgi:23S rRNA pseudouridine1911/1915/1917 synthase
MNILYEDNHIIALNKACCEIVQGDKTGDIPLSEQLKEWLKEKYNKPGNAFVGITHRLDRPVSGIILFAKTSKALSRLNEMFRLGKIEKTYWAIVRNPPPKEEDTLTHWLVRNEQQNKSYACDRERPNSKQAILHYRIIAQSDKFHLLEIDLKTGRHHQIRSQLSAIGCPIRGDLKYGCERSNHNKGINLHARSARFIHPISKENIHIIAPVPQDPLWENFSI